MKDDIRYFNFVGLAFELTDQCPIICRSCLRDCRPDKNNVMSFEQICKIIDNRVTRNTIRQVGFSGGECFLYPELLERACQYIQDTLGVPISITTNAFWAETPRKTQKILKLFFHAGLRSLLISVDDFHLQFLTEKCITNCVQEARNIGIKVTLQVIVTKSSRQLVDFKNLFQFDSNDDGIEWIDNPCDPVGRAAIKIPESEFERNVLEDRTICSIFRLLSIRLDGSVVICCGPGSEAKGMIIGNAFEESLDEIIDRANLSPIMNALALYGGPQLLFKVLSDNDVNKYNNLRFTSSCEACYKLFSDTTAIEILNKALSSERVFLLAERFGLQSKLISVLKNMNSV